MRTFCRASMSLAQPGAGLLPGHAAAQSRVELRAGRSYMDNHGTNAAFLEAIGEQRPMGFKLRRLGDGIFIGMDKWTRYRTLRPRALWHYRTYPSTELLAAGARWQLLRANAWYRGLYASFQLAYNHQATQALSSHYQFVSGFGWQGEQLSFQLRHVSNGGLHHPNRRETMALVGIGFSL